jgi:hypothetical protein
LLFKGRLDWKPSFNQPLPKEIALARKSPSSKPKSSTRTNQKERSVVEKRVAYLLDYISRVNRQTLVAILHLSEAPDCQIDETPSLIRFSHDFEEAKFYARGFVTKAQSTLLEKAASQSLDALLDQALQLAKGLAAPILTAQQSLVAALEPASGSARAEVFVPPILGCCFFTDRPPEPSMPQSLCKNDPYYAAWSPGDCPVERVDV